MYRSFILSHVGKIGRRSFSTGKSKFYDMKQSNNAARIRLWLAFKENSSDYVDSIMVTGPDLKSPEFTKVNPLQKVPALIGEDENTVFESHVILNFLEHKYSQNGSTFTPDDPNERQLMDLIIRCHDLYIASPNSTQPGNTASQGAMYLAPYPTQFCNASRVIDRPSRAAKLAEIWNQLQWLDEQMSHSSTYMVGNRMSLADFTWFPTTIFMEFMLPRVFGWVDLFRDDNTPFPHLAKWWRHVSQLSAFAAVREDIYSFWEERWKAGQFVSIIGETNDPAYKWQYPVDERFDQWQLQLRQSSSLRGIEGENHWKEAVPVVLNYQKPPPIGKRIGRYIDQPDKGDLDDTHLLHETMMHNGRTLNPPASLDNRGFLLTSCPTAVAECQFRDDEEVVKCYYPEMAALVKSAIGASEVFVFDHTIRDSQTKSLNAPKGHTAGYAQRVHC